MEVKKDGLMHKTKWIISKFKSDDDFKKNKPFERVEIDGNLFLNEGIGEIWDLACGLSTPTAFNNANARIGVGDGTVAEDAAQTGLQGTNKAFVGMEAGYPQRSGNTVTFRSVFDGDTGNFSWQEFTIVNGADDTAVNMNRKVSNQGTKASGQTWTIDLQVSLS